MNNVFIYRKLLDYLKEEEEAVKILINADNELGLLPTYDEVVEYLEYSFEEKTLSGPLVGNIFLTEGDILSTLKIVHDLVNSPEGKYTLFINEMNIGLNTYIVDKVNKIYDEYNLDLKINLDYRKNYNQYLNSLVTIVGSEDYVMTASKDFKNANQIIV